MRATRGDLTLSRYGLASIVVDIMDADLREALDSARALADEYRARCLWFLRADYLPATPEEACRVLTYIERHGDLQAYRRAAPLRQWLSRHSSGQ